MNAQIKDLILEAGYKMFGEKVIAADFSSSGNATLCSQKFAELLLKDVCEKVVQPYMSRFPDDCELVTKIKQHYGVE